MFGSLIFLGKLDYQKLSSDRALQGSLRPLWFTSVNYAAFLAPELFQLLAPDLWYTPSHLPAFPLPHPTPST